MMQTAQHSPDLPTRCELQHQIFSTLGDVRFRLSATDRIPMMALQLGEREAQLPLEALRREFSIAKDSADGRMLDLIGSALDYVAFLQPGDKLPDEIRTGQASWTPSPTHRRLALTRLQLDLCAWVEPTSRWAGIGRDELTLLRMADDPALREEVYAVASPAAELLGMRDGAEAIAALEELSHELAYIEALRDRLLRRAVGLGRRVGALLRDRQRAAVSFDTLTQVHRLMGFAVKQIVQRFEDLAVQTAEIDALLRNVDNQRSFIRSHRDWLYRSQRAWEPMLDRWGHAETADEIATLLAATYQFLAPRFMPTSAWQRPRPARGAAAERQMAW